MKIVVNLDASPEFRAAVFPETPEEWAEKITADIYDQPAIETRQEFKDAMIRAFENLRLPPVELPHSSVDSKALPQSKVESVPTPAGLALTAPHDSAKV